MTQRFEQRAKDAVSRLFVQKLLVPKVFFDPHWPQDGRQVDLMAVDRAGTGDVHVVEIIEDASAIQKQIDRVLSVPANYLWIAFDATTVPDNDYSFIRGLLFPNEGMGRIGLIKVASDAQDRLTATVVVEAERFKQQLRKGVQEYASTHPADIEF